MPDIDPAALSRTDSIPQLSANSLGNSKWGEYKEAMSLFVLGRCIQTQLGGIPGQTRGERMLMDYPLLIGQLNQNELSLRIDHYVIC